MLCAAHGNSTSSELRDDLNATGRLGAGLSLLPFDGCYETVSRRPPYTMSA